MEAGLPRISSYYFNLLKEFAKTFLQVNSSASCGNELKRTDVSHSSASIFDSVGIQHERRDR